MIPRMHVARVVGIAVLAAAGSLHGAQLVQNGAAVRGTVIRLGSTETLPGTRVDLIRTQGAGSTSYTAATGNDGSFVFSDVQPGEYRLLASRTDGFLPAEYGQRNPDIRGLPLTLGSGQTLKDVQLGMAAAGSISGRVTDRNGQPVGRILVHALRMIYRDGRRESGIIQSVLTNDLGEYRLFWLAPGPYYVVADTSVDINSRAASLFIRRPEDGGMISQASDPTIIRRVLDTGDVVEEVYPPVYAPGTTDFQKATPVLLHAGDNFPEANVRFPAAMASRHIRGAAVLSATGAPAAGAFVRAVPRDPGPYVTIPSATADKNGVFDIAGVASGSYDLFATTSPANGPSFGGGRLPVEVGSVDLQNVSLAIPPGLDISGRFVIDNPGGLDIAKLRARLQRDPDVRGAPLPQEPSAIAETAADGSFRLAGVGAGDYRIVFSTLNGPRATAGLPDGVYLKSIRMGSIDVLRDRLRLNTPPDGRLEILLGTDAGEVTGTVVNEKANPIANVAVALVPEQALRYRIDLYKSAATDSAGHFAIAGIAPGNYKLFAWDDVENGTWMDPEFLRSFEGKGTFVHVGEKSKETAQLSVIGTAR